MPTVSILIPAYRPDFLDVSISSALAQSYGDFELIISDDSGGDVVASVVSKWKDPRIKYCRNPNLQMPGTNRDHLLQLASGKYAKFLFDDDMLMPRSLELLVAAMEQTGAAIAFHNRHVIDRHGKLLDSPEVVPEGKTVSITPDFLFDQLMGNTHNFIGEPTNILIDLAILRGMDNPFGLNEGRMRFLTDVALYANFAGRNHKFAGVGYMGAGFRRHSTQNSSSTHPMFAAGLFEWELLLRWSAENAHLPIPRYESSIQVLHAAHQIRQSEFPELALFLALEGKRDSDGYLGQKYRDTLASAYMTLELKQIAARNAAHA